MSSSLPSFVRPVLALAFPLLLSACGGGGGSSGELALALVTSPTTAQASVSASESFPTGLVVASPAELGSVSAAAASTTARALAVPLGVGAGRAELTDMAARIEAVLAGDTSVSLGGLLSFGNLFLQGSNAGCYGPQLLYANHEDGSGTESGLLPGGDLGLWLPTDAASGQPCVVAQLNERTAGVKHATRQGLLLMAVMRATITGSGGVLALPAAGFSTDLSTPFSTVLAAVPALAGLTVHAATVSLDPFGEDLHLPPRREQERRHLGRAQRRDRAAAPARRHGRGRTAACCAWPVSSWGPMPPSAAATA